MTPGNAQRLAELRAELDAEFIVLTVSNTAVLCVVVPRDGADPFPLVIDESQRYDRPRH